MSGTPVVVGILICLGVGLPLSLAATGSIAMASIPNASEKKLFFPGSNMMLKRRSVKNTPISPNTTRCFWFKRIFMSSQNKVSCLAALS